MENKWPCRVVVSGNDIRRFILDQKPSNLGSFLSYLKSELDLPYDFKVQFEDPLFNNALCNLTNVSELPDVATLKIISLESPSPLSSALSSPSTSSQRMSSPGTSDTEILLPETSEPLRQEPWPTVFDIPLFSVDINYRLRQGDLAYMKDETYRLNVSRDMKHGILERLAEKMYKYTAYATGDQCKQVAAALIAKHPCLREAGSPTGYCAWKNSLVFKVGNYRTKMKASGWADVTVHGKRRDSPNGEPSSRTIKKPKRSETNFLPNFPEGQNAETLETGRVWLESEAKKRLPDSAEVKKMMGLTFSLRRKEIVEQQPPVKTMMDRWPALFTESQVCSLHCIFS